MKGGNKMSDVQIAVLVTLAIFSVVTPLCWWLDKLSPHRRMTLPLPFPVATSTKSPKIKWEYHVTIKEGKHKEITNEPITPKPPSAPLVSVQTNLNPPPPQSISPFLPGYSSSLPPGKWTLFEEIQSLEVKFNKNPSILEAEKILLLWERYVEHDSDVYPSGKWFGNLKIIFYREFFKYLNIGGDNEFGVFPTHLMPCKAKEKAILKKYQNWT